MGLKSLIVCCEWLIVVEDRSARKVGCEVSEDLPRKGSREVRSRIGDLKNATRTLVWLTRRLQPPERNYSSPRNGRVPIVRRERR